MSTFDLPLDQLREYRPERHEPDDFDAFWQDTLAESRDLGTPPVFEPYASPLRTVDVFDVTFSGFGGQPIRGWLLVPAGATGPLPTVVEYIGYGGGRSFPIGWLGWSAAGYANLVMDTRGQGSTWSPGDTPDIEPVTATGQHPGFTTRGVDDPRTFYYRRLVADAVLATEAAAHHPLVDPERIVVTGRSQGGGLALAVAGLAPKVRAAAIDVPFLCHWRRAVEITDETPYSEIRRYLSVRRGRADEVFNTLSYVEGMSFAARATCPALFSVALMDEICPPSTIFAAFNHYRGPAEISVWPFNGHEGGDLQQVMDQLAFWERLGIAP